MKINSQTISKKGRKYLELYCPLLPMTSLENSWLMDLSEYARLRKNIFRRADSYMYTRSFSAQSFP